MRIVISVPVGFLFDLYMKKESYLITGPIYTNHLGLVSQPLVMLGSTSHPLPSQQHEPLGGIFTEPLAVTCNFVYFFDTLAKLEKATTCLFLHYILLFH